MRGYAREGANVQHNSMTPALNKPLPEFEALATGGVKFTPAAFAGKTGTPVLLNTSFNENEPIVHTPEQAIDCFRRTRMDALGIGSFWLEKPAEPGEGGAPA